MIGMIWNHLIGSQRFMLLQLEDSYVHFFFGFISTLKKIEFLFPPKVCRFYYVKIAQDDS